MDHTDVHTSDLADETAIRDIYQFYVGRAPTEETIAAQLAHKVTVGRLEANIITQSREYWSKGPVLATHRRGAWDGSILIVRPARLVFCPIAKVANTSVKDWVLRLTGHETEANLVHKVLDGGRIKLQARYRSERGFDAIMRDPDWARVAILRDPLDRLVSCYWDKFVRTRKADAVLHHTRPVYQFIYGEEAPTPHQLNHGITFRQFCQYINLNRREAMDPHWAPQSRYLETYRWDHLFRIDRIDAFERFVLDRCPAELQDIRLGMRNVAPRNKAPVETLLADTPPIQLETYAKLPNEVFVTPDIEDFIRDYFALDYMLLDRAEG
jgi:hypothetical protein